MTLYQLLGLTRPIILFDLETTGPDPRNDRIVELGLLIMREDSEKEWRTLINPERSIPKEATEKHGIDDARLLLCNNCAGTREDHPKAWEEGTCQEFVRVPFFREIAANLYRGFSTSDLCGFNIRSFDIPVLTREFELAEIKWDASQAKLVDGFRLWQLAEPRTLSDFVKRWAGEDLTDAHHALADVRGTKKGILALLQQIQTLPRTLDALHDLQFPVKPRNPNWIDSEGKFIWGDDNQPLVNFGKRWSGKPMKIVERKFWKWMLDPQQNFAPDTLQIVRDLLEGKFPVRQREDPLAPPAD